MSKTNEKSNYVFESSAKNTKSNNYHGSSVNTDRNDSQFKYFKRDDQQVIDLYEFEQTIGQGHYAVVKLAKHRFTSEKVAIKIIDKLKLDKISRDHLYQEVKCMKLVQHANVVRLYEVIDTPSKLYLILELGDGGDMYDVIMKHANGISEKQSKNYFRQIVSAIKYCHDLHVVHRDLKPENVVFFSQTGQVKLTDFGFSNIFVPGTKLLTSCGSLAYSAPEILLGDSYDAPAVDIWSLGVILYMLVTGRAPFQEANDSETLTMILDCKYYLPPNLSSDCIELISRMLVRDPEKRILLDEIDKHRWFKELEEDEENDLSIEEVTDSSTNSSDESLTRNFPNSVSSASTSNSKRSRTKSKEKLLKMVTLVRRENLTEKQNEEIINSMVIGKISSRDEIIKALDEDQYNYITGTYYLLAERLIKKQLQKKIRRKQNTKLKKTELAKNPIPQKKVEQQQIPHSAPANLSTNLNQYQLKRKLNAQTQRNKLVRQVEEEEETEPDVNQQNSTDQNLIIQSKLGDGNKSDDSLHSSLQPITNILLTNIIEDEEDVASPKSKSQDMFLINQPLQSRRSSRGTDNTISTLTILEEVETDLTSPHQTPKSHQTGSYLVKQVNNVENVEKFNDAASSNEEQKKNFTLENFSSSADKLDVKLDPIIVASKNKKYSSETSCSDNSDNELKFHGLKDYDWNRSASSSGRSRNRYRHSNHNTQSLTEQPVIKRTRPISISTDTNDINSESKLGPFRESLGNNKESASSSGCLSITSPYKQSVSTSNSNDYLANNLVSKSLSIEHRLANMSQMSINSQLSKNNSIRQRQNGGADTPVQQQLSQQLSTQHSTTPTPRESIVFNRGDDKPISKILSHGKSSTDAIFNTEGGVMLKNSDFRSLNSIAGATENQGNDIKNFNMNNHDRPVSAVIPDKKFPTHLPSQIVTTSTTRPFSSENELKSHLENFDSSANPDNNMNSISLHHKNDSYSIAVSNIDANNVRNLEKSNSVKSIDELTNTTTTKLDDSDKTLKSSSSFIGNLTNKSLKQSNKVINSTKNMSINAEDESNLLKHSASYTSKSNKYQRNEASLRPSIVSTANKKKCYKCCTII